MMQELFTLNALFTLLMLIFLQAVLGFDNLLYISIESKRVEESKQAYVRRIGIGLAVLLRIVLLFVILAMFGSFEEPFFSYDKKGVFHGEFNVESIIVMLGGVFIIYTAIKEIHHMLAIQHFEHNDNKKKRSVGVSIFWIVLMNLVFSFDSILSAIALTDNFILVIISIAASGLMMVLLADTVSEFLKKNRMYEVLGLFILFIVGIMLVSEGAHKAHLSFFGNEITPMSKGTFYFVIVVLVLIDIAQSRYQRKLHKMKEHEIDSPEVSSKEISTKAK